MSEMSTQTVTFSPEEERFVKSCVESGRFQSTNEVVHEGLRLLAHEEQVRRDAFVKVRAMIAAGAEEIERGETVNAEDVFQRLRLRSEKLQREAQA